MFLYRFLFTGVLAAGFLFTSAQQTLNHQDEDKELQQAREWFYQGKYALAYPVLQQLQLKQPVATEIKGLKAEELEFLIIACQLVNRQTIAVDEARRFMAGQAAPVYKNKLALYLGDYYFLQEDYAAAATEYSRVAAGDLNDDQLALLQFRHGYSLFTQKNYKAARPLLDAVRQSSNAPYYTDANYYFGLIAFQEQQYREAMRAFDIAKTDAKYQPLVGYYNAAISYALGEKDKSIQLAEQAYASNNSAFKTELQQLLGHAYFEKKNYVKAQQYLEPYVKASSKVRREDLYELAYSYYTQQQYSKAIEQFKPLSSGNDSLSMHAMYLLGDAYLKTGDKSNARNAYLFAGSNPSNAGFRGAALFHYGKLSYELGFDAEALSSLRTYTQEYRNGEYVQEANDLIIQSLTRTSNYREALEMYEKTAGRSSAASKLYPQVAFNRAQELINDGENEKAELLLDKAIAYGESEVLPLLYFWKGEMAYDRDAFNEAMQLYQRYLNRPVSNGEASVNNARYNMGYTLLRLGEYSDAAKQFEAISNVRFEDATQRTDVTLRHADALYMQKDFDRAATLYSSVSNQRGFGADYAVFQNGMIAGAKQQPQTKITTLRSLETLYPKSSLLAEAWLEIANTYMADEKFRDAIPYLNKVISSSRETGLRTQALLKAGLAYYNTDNDAQALTMFKNLVKQYPNAPEADAATDNIRSIYVEQGKPDAYVSFMREAGRSVNAEAADSLTYTAAELKLSDGNKTEALNGFLKYLQQYPNGQYKVEANYYAAELYRENKNMAAALKYYEAVAALQPNKFAEQSLLQLARHAYFETKNYKLSAEYFTRLKEISTNSQNRLEALRGLVRSQYYGGAYEEAETNANELLAQNAAGTDDKVFANMLLARKEQRANNCTKAIEYYKQVANLSKAEIGAEARYETAKCYEQLGRLDEAEKAAFEVIKKSGSYETWVTKSYILLGDIFMAQKDYFNAKATYKSVADNATDAALKKEAADKLAQAERVEAAASKLDKN